MLLRLHHILGLGPINKCNNTKVLKTYTFAGTPKCQFMHKCKNWAKAPSPRPLLPFTSASKLAMEVRIPPKYLKLPTYSTWPLLMVAVAGSHESPLPINMTLVFAALILMANRSATVSMHCNISTRFSGLVENKTMSST